MTAYRPTLLLLLPLFLACTFGGETQSGRRIVLPADSVHNGWYFATGDQILLQGTVNGDVFVAGGVVEVEGTINGQLTAAGGQVTVSGSVTDRILAAGGTIRLEGKTGKSAIAAGGSILLGKNAVLGENLLAAGGNVQVHGTVGRDAKIAAGDIELTGTIPGNLDASAKRFSTYSGSRIGGNLSVWTRDTTQISITPGTVQGALSITQETGAEPRQVLGLSEGVLLWRIWFGLSLFATALALAFLFPTHLTAPGQSLLDHPGWVLIWGCVALVATPVVAVLLFITVIGIPLGVGLLALYGWGLYASQLVFGIALGARILGPKSRRGWALFGSVALGLLIVQILMVVPYLHTLLLILGFVAGLGAFVHAVARARTRASHPEGTPQGTAPMS